MIKTDQLIQDDILSEKHFSELSNVFLTWNCIFQFIKERDNDQEKQLECDLVLDQEKSYLDYNFNNKMLLNSFHLVEIQFEVFFSTFIKRQLYEIKSYQNSKYLQKPLKPEKTQILPKYLNNRENWKQSECNIQFDEFLNFKQFKLFFIKVTIYDLNGHNPLEKLSDFIRQKLQLNGINSSFALLKNIKLKLKACPDMCLSCASSSSGIVCLKCMENAILNSAKQCICNRFSIKGQNKCTDQCPTGYIEDTQNQLCLPKLELNCVSWTLNICIQCVSNNYVNLNGQCVEKQQLKDNIDSFSYQFNKRNKYLSTHTRNQTQDTPESSNVIYIPYTYEYKTQSRDQFKNSQDLNYQKRLLGIKSEICNLSFCLICSDNSICSQCIDNYYNINGKCLKEIKFIDFDNNTNLIVFIITLIVFTLALIETIIISFFRNPNTILLNTSFAVQKISYLNITPFDLPIQIPDLFKSFNCNFYLCYIFPPKKHQFCGQYYLNYNIRYSLLYIIIIIKTEISPFMIFKSTSWINDSILPQQSQQYINFFFSINQIDGNIVSNSSGCLLFMIYILIIFFIFVYLANKRFQKAYKIYEKILCGFLFQINAQSTQILISGFILQIIYYTSDNQNIFVYDNRKYLSNEDYNTENSKVSNNKLTSQKDSSNDSLLPLNISIMILNVLLVSISFYFFYNQANIAKDNIILNQKNSIQKINCKVIQNNCYNVTWIQRNYTFLLIIKESIIFPIIIIFCRDQSYSTYIILLIIESIHLVFQLYTRPYLNFLDNLSTILCCLIWISIFTMKLFIQILTNKLVITTKYISNQESIISQLRSLDIAVFIVFMIILLSFQIIPIIKCILLSSAKSEAQQPLVKQLDSFQKIQLQFYGYQREDPSLFKINDEFLNERKLKQEFLRFKENWRLSKRQHVNQSQIETTTPSFNPSPQMASIKARNLNKEKDKEIKQSQSRKASVFALNNNVYNNSSFLQLSECVSKENSKKNSELIIPRLSCNEDKNRDKQIKSTNEIKEEQHIQVQARTSISKLNRIKLVNSQNLNINPHSQNSINQINNKLKKYDNVFQNSILSLSSIDQSSQPESDSSQD